MKLLLIIEVPDTAYRDKKILKSFIKNLMVLSLETAVGNNYKLKMKEEK